MPSPIRTVVEKNGSQIIYRANTTLPVPNLDVLTLLFDSPHCPAPGSLVLHADASDPSLHLTKSQTIHLTQRVAHALRSNYSVGTDPKSKYVTCISGGNYMLPTIFYGVIAAAGIFSSVGMASTVKELVRLIQLAPSNIVVCNSDTKAVSLAAAQECGIPLDNVLEMLPATQQLIQCGSGRNILGASTLAWPRITDPTALKSTPICLIYSSGTTGLPKGVPLTHENVVAEAALTCGMHRAQILEDDPNYAYVTLSHLPVAHIAGLQGYMINPVFMGGTTYWMARFDFAQFLEYNARYKVNTLFTVPPIYLLIAKSPAVTDQFKDMRLAYTGAAPMKKELQLQAGQKLGKSGVSIMQTWGLSESTGSTTLLDYKEGDDSGSVSRLIANMSARVVDEQGKDVGEGQEGEIYLKGPVIFRGYHNNEEANRGAFDSDGWFMTGDVGVFKGGLLYVVDRKKELIKYKGHQVAPAELEGLLITHPEILDAAVIGVESEGEEVPRAYVVVADRNKTNEEVIKAFVKEHAASYKQLRGGVIYMDAIPKSPSGKILRKDIRLMAKEDEKKLKSKL